MEGVKFLALISHVGSRVRSLGVVDDVVEQSDTKREIAVNARSFDATLSYPREG